MNKEEIHSHWTQWAQEHGEAIEATTRTQSAKSIELSALNSAFVRYTSIESAPINVLEVGCGNGVNCVSIASHFPQSRVCGVDFVPEMVEHARSSAQSAKVSEHCTFLNGDALQLETINDLPHDFDIAFTVRCLINLQSDENQRQALKSIADRVVSGGYIFLIENSQQSYARQNNLRTTLGLETRNPASFNHFIDEVSFLDFATECGLTLQGVVDISSLHDTVLYALLPSITGGEIDYKHPLVHAATQLEIAHHEKLGSPFGDFGQNRLFIFHKKS
jgi:ubiquinone/menaquinone biosynthesis C-methylase UbiE